MGIGARPGGPLIRFENVRVVYTNGAQALGPLSLDLPRGRLSVVLGGSGAGKTTLLRLVNRLVEPTAGCVLVDGRDVAAQDPVSLRRGIGYVIQEVGLLPHMSVAENVAVVPRLLGWERSRAAEAVRRSLAAVRMEEDLFGARYPSSLSGGQRQRVGIARALAADPELLLMDEPFGALDPALREELQDELKELARRLGKTVVFVTHDMREAVHLADRLVVLLGGRVVQEGSPREVVLHPADDSVVRLLGRHRRDLERCVGARE